MENNAHQLDPSHELPAGDDEIMAGSIYEQLKAQEAEMQAAAEQQAIVDAAREEAEQSPRLGQEERAYFRAIARAANTAELPEGVPQEERLATLPFRSTPAKAREALEAMRADAKSRLSADRKDRNEEKQARKAREQAEEAERQAEEKRQAEAEAAKLKAEEDARQAKLDAERARVHKEAKSRHATSDEDLDAKVESEINEKHGELSETSKSIMRPGLRERFAREADAAADTAASKEADDRIAYIKANGGADAIDAIRAKEAEEAQRQAEEADRQAFLDRLHGRGGNREAFREAKDQQDAARESGPTETPADRFLGTADADQLRALVGADVDNLPDGLDPELRRSLLPVHVGRNQAQANLDALRGRAQERLNEVDGSAGDGSDPNAANTNNSTPDNDSQQPDQGESDAEREQRFSDLYELEDVDRDEWRRQLNALSPEDRNAYYQYGLDRMRNETTGPVLDPGDTSSPRVWPDPNTSGRAPVPPAQPRPATPPAFPSVRRRPLGGTDPFAPMPVRARSGANTLDPSDIAPVVPEITSGRGPWPKGIGPKIGRAWAVATDWWPGRSAQSFLPDTRPSLLRGGRRQIANGFRALGRSINTSPEMSDDERAAAEGDIRGNDNAPTPPPAPVVPRSRVNRVRRPGDRTPPPPSAIDGL